MAKNDGGQAFPAEVDGSDGFTQVGDQRFRVPGLTKRDWFAGQVLPEMVRQSDDVPVEEIKRAMVKYGVKTVDQLTARRCYELADAMLAERVR